jgi:hypothetical protein
MHYRLISIVNEQTHDIANSPTNTL